MQVILSDVETFLSPKTIQFYVSNGIPYRRGYLLYGPPGCGKSSFAQVVASHFDLDICCLNLASGGMNDDSIAEALRAAPTRSIILLEDVDAIFVQREAGNDGTFRRQSSLSFSGLLNAIDGVVAQEGRILIMTTNHIERLDPALIRPGRCDRRLEVKKASKSQLKLMYTRFFSGYVGQDKEEFTEETLDKLSDLFAAKVPEFEVSMAALQNFFLQYRSLPPYQVIENIDKLYNNPTKIVMIEGKHSLLLLTCLLAYLLMYSAIYGYLRKLNLHKFTKLFELYGVYNTKYLDKGRNNLSITHSLTHSLTH